MDDHKQIPEGDATEHLIRAGRELLAAARSTIDTLDAYLAVLEERHGEAKHAEPVEAIPIRRDRA